MDCGLFEFVVFYDMGVGFFGCMGNSFFILY